MKNVQYANDILKTNLEKLLADSMKMAMDELKKIEKDLEIFNALKKAKWIKQTDLTFSPDFLKKSSENLSNIVQNSNKVLEVIKKYVSASQVFINKNIDIMTTFMNSALNGISQVIKDVMALGGSMITITPFNRAKPRTVTLGSSTNIAVNGKDTPIFEIPLPSISVPAMTPREALNEFYASFDNTNDIERPRWTINNGATGIGFLITANMVSDFTEVVQAFNSIVSLGEISKSYDAYTEAMNRWSAEVELARQQREQSLATLQVGVGIDVANAQSMLNNSVEFASTASVDIWGVATTGDFSLMSSTVESIYTSTGNTAVGVYNAVSNQVADFVTIATTAGSLRWKTLSVESIPIMREIRDLIESLLNQIRAFIKQPNASDILFNALLNKIKVIQDFINTMYETIMGILVKSNAGTIYTFSIEPDYGGVDYIKTAIEDGLKDGSADSLRFKEIENKYQYSMLFFMRASTGVNLDAWYKLFAEPWEKLVEGISNQFDPPFHITINPDFGSGVPFKFKSSHILSVMAPESTSQNPLYFTYIIRGHDGTTLYSNTNREVGSSRRLRVNKDKVNIVFAYPSGYIEGETGSLTYSIEVEVFNEIGSTLSQDLAEDTRNSVRYKKKFVVSENPAVPRPTDGGVTLEGETDEEITIYKCPEKIVLYRGYMSGTTLPFTLSPEGNYCLQIGDAPIQPVPPAVPENVLSFTDPNNIPPTIKSKTWPVDFCLDFYGALMYRQLGEEFWVNVSLPACIYLEQEKEYEYMIFKDGVWSDIKRISTKTRTTSTPIC